MKSDLAQPYIHLEDVINASRELQRWVNLTPLQRNEPLSDKYGANIYLKREDLQVVRSFKIRGACIAILNLTEEERARGVVCASAGNHAQGVAYSCREMGIFGKIFMPTTTPRQKVSQVKRYGGENVEVVLIGDTFDDAFAEAKRYCDDEQKSFIHPFDDERTIIGQGTIGLEILNQMSEPIDLLLAGIGGGGLIAGVGSYMKQVSPATRIIGVEPSGAPAMQRALEAGYPVVLDEIDKFVDGAAVKQVGALTLNICQDVLSDVVSVPEGKVCTSILELYNDSAIVAEPAGALPIAALDHFADQIKGKNVVCVLSGGNNDIDRMQEIKERSLIFEGFKHYFVIQFPQRSGALREFLDEVLGPDDDITRFEYTKKTNRDAGPALVGIELKHREDYDSLIERMRSRGISFTEINKDPHLFQLLV